MRTRDRKAVTMRMDRLGGSALQDPDFDTLERCFQKVFPFLAPDAIPTCAHGDFPQWDSLAHATLLAHIGEEFGIEIDALDAFDGATSFASLLAVLRKRHAGRQ